MDNAIIPGQQKTHNSQFEQINDNELKKQDIIQTENMKYSKIFNGAKLLPAAKPIDLSICTLLVFPNDKTSNPHYHETTS